MFLLQPRLILTTEGAARGGGDVRNKSRIIPEEIHNMKYLVLFYLTEMLEEKKQAAANVGTQKCFLLP